MSGHILIKYKDDIIRKWEFDDGFICYSANDIGKILRIKQVSVSIKNFDNSEIIDTETREKYNIITYRRYKNDTRKDNSIILLTNKGLKKFLCISRSPESSQLAKFFNIDVNETKVTPIESTTIKIIQDTFNGEEMHFQYWVDKYRVDLYFPKYRIAIECDENGHSDRDLKYELQREEHIKEKLNCTFVRYNPDSINFNISYVLNSIFRIILSFMKEL